MMEAFYLGFIILTVILAAVVANYAKNIARLKRQQIGVKWLQCLRVLLSHVQQHRGLTSGFLNGDKSVEEKIYQLQSLVSADISNVVKVSGWITKTERWQNITQHWARLAGRFTGNTADNNLLQHNKLIQSILYLIDEMAEEHDLLLVRSYGNKPLHFVWRELLSASECIGQARAIGSGVVAAGRCDSVSRIRLNYLTQKIRSSTSIVWDDIPPTPMQRQKVEQLLSCIESKVIVDQPDIMLVTFFDVASNALDSLHEQYDEVLKSLKLSA